jgi:hypothetical protein
VGATGDLVRSEQEKLQPVPIDSNGATDARGGIAMTEVAQRTDSEKTAIRPFTVSFPETELTELRNE